MSITSSVKNRLIRIGFLLAAGLLAIFILSKIDCSHVVGSWFNPDDWHKPNWITDVVVKPDTLATKPHDPSDPGVVIEGGSISPHGDIALMVMDGSLDHLLAFNTSHYHGTGTIIVENGQLKIYYPRFGIEPILTGGISLPELGGVLGLQTVYINNFLWTERTLHVPVIKAGWISSDVRAGIGLDYDIAQSVGIGGSYMWRVSASDSTLLRVDDPQIFADIHVDFWTF